MSDACDPIPLDFTEVPPDEMRERARAFRARMSRRRSVRDFSDRPVPRELIEEAIRTAGTAPSGAHRQPWQFVAVDDPDLKREIREAAEAEEKEFYENRVTEEWEEALAPLGTDWRKPYLETAPWLVVCFAEQYGLDKEGEKTKNYYVQESVGIACGLFITAIHNMGLATLTHTPAPMTFLRDLERKSLDEIVQWNR
jgi:iodotyrosine deiodinase